MSDYRLAVGTLTAAALLADSNSIVADWPRSDARETWIVETMTLVNPGVTRVRVWGNGIAEKGNAVISSWSINLSYNQTDWLEDNIFNGAPSVAVTIQTLNLYKGATWEVYNCFAVRPVLIEGTVVQKNNLWFPPFKISFLPGTLAAES